MLRNYIKSSYCGLIAILVSSCSTTNFLLEDTNRAQCVNDDLMIVGEPFYEYKLRSQLPKNLRSHGFDFSKHKIKVILSERGGSVAFTGGGIAKEQIRLIANVILYDKNYTKLSEKVLDAYTTYEISDRIPYAAHSSKEQAKDIVIEELAYSIAIMATEMVRTYQLDQNNK
ncbi:MAG: hypothetical protein IJ481_00190 [Alphaproteobacteria bacterium]|nr:hypothetical protein [Alphaproteobacteria bacterium]